MSLLHVLLIRHGETVDNVAGLYAGVRDSALTSHGVLQIQRLADHLAASSELTRPEENDLDASKEVTGPEPEGSAHISIFSSDLVRAVKTAEAISEALYKLPDGTSFPVVQVRDLREKNFGTGEGTKFGGGRKDGATRPQDHIGAESREDMKVRAHRFITDHLLPCLPRINTSSKSIIVVAHGLILSSLFHALCEVVRNSRKDSPDTGIDFYTDEVEVSFDPSGIPRLPSWSNTGYLEADIVYQLSPTQRNPKEASLSLFLRQVNCTTHLAGLKKTKGGIGSAKFDDKQKRISSFFTKPPAAASSSSSSPSKKRKAPEDDDDVGRGLNNRYVRHNLSMAPDSRKGKDLRDEAIQIHRPVPKYNPMWKNMFNRCLIFPILFCFSH